MSNLSFVSNQNHYYFTLQIVDFFFLLNRTSNMNTFRNRLDELMFSLKTALYNCDDSSEILKLISYFVFLYKCIGYTRDIYDGKGERDLTYQMIYIWHKYFPIPALYSLHFLTQPIMYQHTYHYSYGSWKDILYFCRFVKKVSSLGIKDPLIDYSVNLMNQQLVQDILLNQENKKKNNISMVSKWIPRENSAFHWLYELCVLQWAHCYHPIYFSTVKNKIQYEKAFSKYKREYRQHISLLSKSLDILQIKQCNGKWRDIHPNHISVDNFHRQSLVLLNTNRIYSVRFQYNEDRIQCAQNIYDYYNKKYISTLCPLSVTPFQRSKNETCFKYKPSIHLSISQIAREIHILLRKRITSSFLSEKKYSDSFLFLESFYQHRILFHWKQILSRISSFQLPIIPLVHLFDLEETSERNESFILANVISNKSMNRMIVYDSCPTWIQTGSDIIENMKNIYTICQGRGDSSMNKENSLFRALELLILSFQQTQLSSENVSKLVLIVFSDFSTFSEYDDFHVQVVSFFQKNGYLISPSIIYWNISKKIEYLSIPFQSLHSRAFVFSGNSISFLSFLCKLNEKYLNEQNAYTLIVEMLNQPRWNCMESYFIGLLQ